MQDFNVSDIENDLSQGKKGKVIVIQEVKPYDNKERAKVVAFGECSSPKCQNLLQVRIHYFKEDHVVFRGVSRQVNLRKICCHEQHTEQKDVKVSNTILAFHICTN